MDTPLHLNKTFSQTQVKKKNYLTVVFIIVVIYFFKF